MILVFIYMVSCFHLFSRIYVSVKSTNTEILLNYLNLILMQ